MNPLLRKLFARLQKPAGDDGSDTGGTDAAVIDPPAAAGKEDRGDTVDPALNPDTLAAVVADAGAEGEGDPAAAGEPASTGARIPKARFDEVNEGRKAEKARADALEAELAALKAGKPATAAPRPAPAPAPAPAAAQAPDLKSLRAQHRAAVAAGDDGLVAALDEVIDAEVIRIAEDRAMQRYAQQQVATTLQSASDTVRAEFPYLDTADGAEVVEMIVALRDRKIAAGVEPAKALLDAARHVAPKFAPVDDENTGRASPEATPPKDTRTAAALARGAADSNLQPPTAQAGIGNRSSASRTNVATLTEEQFANLDAAEKKRLRGD